MAKSKVIGADSFISMVEELAFNSESIASMAVYKGAETIADGIRDSIEKIPSRDANATRSKEKVRGITDVEREGLLNGLGVAQHRKKAGDVDTKIGFDGYNANVTKAYPKGHPNSMIARSIESGTSWLNKTPFIAPAVRRLRAAATEAMQKELDDYIKKHT